VQGQKKPALVSEAFFDAQGGYADNPGGYARKLNVYEQDRLISTAYYGAQGQLIKPLGSYALLEYDYEQNGTLQRKTYWGAGGPGDPVIGPEGGAAVTYIYAPAWDADGNRADRLLEMRVFDGQERPILGVDKFHWQRNTYDERGNLIRTDYYGVDGERVKALDGYASVTHAYDEQNRVIETCYYNAAEMLTKTVTGYARVTYAYYENDKLHWETYYGADSRRTMITEGYSQVEHEYGGDGFDYRITYYDTNDQLTMSMSGYARTEWTYQKGGSDGTEIDKLSTLSRPLVLTQKFFDQKLELVAAKAGHAGYVNTWNEHSQLVETRYMNEQWACSINEEVHYAIVRYRYGSDGERALPVYEAYFDENENPIDAKDGYQARTMEYAGPNGQLLVKEAFWYADGSPDESVASLSHEIRYAYDGRKNNILESHYAPDGTLTRCAKGYAVRSLEYNASGKLLRESFLDEQGGYATVNGKYAARVHSYTPAGQQTGARYFDENGKALMQAGG
ncbi:MAG TPA: hypothetical protein PKE04_20840, partial [Clostridia bacterium]|nr:hypothetical protein [Clostridia bacterium]